jgi:hypothetical protein
MVRRTARCTRHGSHLGHSYMFLQVLGEVPELGGLGGGDMKYIGIGSESGFNGEVSRGQLGVKAIRQTVGRDPPASCTKY